MNSSRKADLQITASMIILFLLGLGVTSALAQPLRITIPHRLELMSGEASITTKLPAHQSLIKPEGESFETVNLVEQTVTFIGSDRLPLRGEVRLDFVSQVDELDRLSLFMFGAEPSELAFEFSSDGETWRPASVRTFVNGTFSVIFNSPLSSGELGSVRYRVDAMDFSAEGPPSAVVDPPLSHVLTSQYQLFNAEGSIFDSYRLTTRISSDGSISPGGLGRLISRPSEGAAGDWVYQSEIDSYFTVYAVGARYPRSASDLIEIFELPSTFGSLDSSSIIQAAEDAVTVYETLYGPFPYDRLGIYPISERAGAAIGPQAQILLPWYFWDENFDIGDPTFEPTAVTYHEIAHQYFFNMVRLNPNPSLGQAWLSEAMAEFSAIRAIEEINGEARWHRWVNFLVYMLTVTEGDEEPVASTEVTQHPNYFPTTYLRGSTLVYGIYHRMSDFTERLRECVTSWRGLFIEAADMFTCFASMSPKAGYVNFDLESYLSRYFLDTRRDIITVSAKWIDDEQSALVINDQEWLDSLEIKIYDAGGDENFIYPQRSADINVNYSGSAALIDPEITTPRLIVNQSPTDVDLNGVVDGQDALDALFSVGVTIDQTEVAFPLHLDVDGDGGISTLDVTEIQREMGRVNE